MTFKMHFVHVVWVFGLILGASGASSDTISGAVAKAVRNDAARNAILADINAQSQSIAIAQSQRGTRIDIFGEAAAERVDNPGSLSASDNDTTKFSRFVGVDLQVNLVDGMRNLNSVFREATLLDSEIIKLADATESLALNTVQVYVDVVRHRRIVFASRKNVAVHERYMSQIEQQVDAGKLTEPDRLRAADKLLTAQVALAEAQSQLADAVSKYQLFVGTPPGGRMNFDRSVSLPRSRAALESAAVRNSLILKLADNNIAAQKYQGEIDAADWKPRVDFFVGGNFGRDRDGVSGEETTLSTGLRLNWTVHKGGARKATEARNRDLLIREGYRKLQIEQQVRDFARRAWNAHGAAQERRMLLDRTVGTNEAIVEAFRSEFEAAKRPLLQVLDAERALFGLKVRQINAEAAVAFQKYRMLAAQNTLAPHFGVSHTGRSLNADFAARVKANPKGDFSLIPQKSK